MNSKKKRIAVAYLVSFLVNGLFWLAYARELRQASANIPKTKPESTARLKPFVLGKFVPLPPLPKKDAKPPTPAEVKNPKETKDRAKEANAEGKRELAPALLPVRRRAQGADGLGRGQRRPEHARAGAEPGRVPGRSPAVRGRQSGRAPAGPHRPRRWDAPPGRAAVGFRRTRRDAGGRTGRQDWPERRPHGIRADEGAVAVQP